MLYEEKILLNPDGDICYLEPKNPYKKKSSSEKVADCENVRISEEEYLTIEMYNDAYKLQNYSKFIRFVSFMDFVFSFWLSYPYYIVLSFISLLGYYGSLTYNTFHLYTYTFYQLAKCVLKIIYICKYFNTIILLTVLYDSYVIRSTTKLIHLIKQYPELG